MRTPIDSTSARALLSAIVAVAASLALGGPAQAQRKERQGKEVVDTVCATCHATGRENAPRIGDAQAWSKRASQGLTALTAHALKGIRNMPAHGGSAGVTDIEIERAITYMVNQSGGHWVEPLGGATPAMVRTSQAVVENQCSKCHATGENGAPRVGDRPAWIPRLQKGLDNLVASAVHGHGAMPARGGMPELSDDEIRGAIVYMFNFGLPVVATVPARPAPPPDPHHLVISGTDVYLGLMRADAVRASLRKNDAAVADIPTGKGYYHVNISLADNQSQVPVTDAQVQLQVSDGMTSQSKALGLVAANNAVSYGSYFRFTSGTAYNIIADIRRPGVAGTIQAKFQFKAP